MSDTILYFRGDFSAWYLSHDTRVFGWRSGICLNSVNHWTSVATPPGDERIWKINYDVRVALQMNNPYTG